MSRMSEIILLWTILASVTDSEKPNTISEANASALW